MIVQCNDNDMIKYIVFVECFNDKLNRVNMTQYDITVMLGYFCCGNIW